MTQTQELRNAKAKVEQYAKESTTWGEFQKKAMNDKELLRILGRKTLNIVVQRSEAGMLLD